ncbi:MAG: hypothetical protein H0T46_20980 [Deltaproteobacteria bacterium]|nr:hypothetical protein [Deltaproteobacteria bacterium]
MSLALRGLALALLVIGCANAGQSGNGGGDDEPGKIDASVKQDSSVAPIDTPPPIDAPLTDAPMIDAPMAMIDAPSGPFCSTNSQCTVSGQCCVTLGGPQGFCAPGTVLAGQCFPN